MHVCRRCGNVVGSHHEVLSVLLSGSIQYTIQYTIIHLDTEASTYCAPHSIDNVESDTCLDLSHVSRLEPRVQTCPDRRHMSRLETRVVGGHVWCEAAGGWRLHPGHRTHNSLRSGETSQSRARNHPAHTTQIFSTQFSNIFHILITYNIKLLCDL